MKLSLILLFTLNIFYGLALNKSDGWEIVAKSKNNYNGVTVANGRIGLVCGKDLFSVSDIVLNGVFDKEFEGGVSRVVRGPIFTNLSIKVDATQVTNDNISDWSQTLNMKEAYIKTSFKFDDKARVDYSIMALRNLPHMGIIIVDVTPLEDITFSALNLTLFPEELNSGKSHYKVLKDAENMMPVYVSEAISRTGMHKLATCSAFLFDKETVATTTDSKNESMSFVKKLNKGETFRFEIGRAHV